MHEKIVNFITENSDLIDLADWSTLFDRMYSAFKSNTWIYPILEALETGLPEYKDEIEELKVIKYRDKVVELMTTHNIQVINSTFLLGQLRNSFGLTTDEMKLALMSDSRFRIGTQNRYDYQIKLL